MNWSERRATMQALVDAGRAISADLVQQLNAMEPGRQVERTDLDEIACELMDAGQDLPDDFLQYLADLDSADESCAPWLSGKRPGSDEC